MPNPDIPSELGSKAGFFIKKKVAYILVAGIIGSLVSVGLVTYFVGVQGVTSDGEQTGEQGGGNPDPTEAPEPPKPPKVTDIRLPVHLKPETYSIHLHPHIKEGDFTIDGNILIKMECLVDGATNITLHAVDIEIKTESIVVSQFAPPVDFSVSDTSFDAEREFFIVKLKEPLKKGNVYTIKMDFVANLRDNLKGFYRSSYLDDNGNKEYIAVTHFQATAARRAFPCFDEPELKAKFSITLVHLPTQTALSNMPLKSSNNENGNVMDQFEESKPMSTYLVAMVISTFKGNSESAVSNKAETLFNIWARPSVQGQTDFALKTGPTILSFFERFFGIEFPLPKLDMIAIPDFSAGAMENWGLITYRETALLYKEGVSSALSKQRVANVISHELAHQWFGNLVTPKWWTDLWLNEGFASYVQYLGVDESDPSLKYKEQFLYLEMHNVFDVDGLESSHPISIPVGHPSEITEIFDDISYSKGASIIRMMDHFLTQETFKSGLKEYLNKHKYGSAEQDDLWSSLTEQAHKDDTLSKDKTVKMIMDTWTLQMGFPVVTVERNFDEKTATVSQEHFLLNPTGKSRKDASKHAYSWWIPLTFAEPGNLDDTKTKDWLEESSSNKELDLSNFSADKPIIFNIQQNGYYRVNYDEHTWGMIQLELDSNRDSIHVLNRAQIYDDSLNLARAGRLSYVIAFLTLSTLKNEKEYVPWASSLKSISYLNKMLQTTPVYGYFKEHIADLVSEQYGALGHDPKNSDTHLDILLRDKMIDWACTMGNVDCLKKVKEEFNKWQIDSVEININTRSTVYCHAIAEGNEGEWNFLLEKYKESDVPSDKVAMLSALACTNEIWLLHRFLQWSIDSGWPIRKQDGASVIAAISRRSIGRNIAFNFVRSNWKKIVEYHGSSSFSTSTIIEAVMSNRNTDFELGELKRFQEDHAGEFGSGSRSVEQAIETTQSNIAWIEANYETIESLLKP